MSTIGQLACCSAVSHFDYVIACLHCTLLSFFHSLVNYVCFSLIHVVLDGAWHHTCIDLGAQARDTLFQEGINIGPAHRVLSVVFNSTDPAVSPSIGSFFIDEFSVSSLVRHACFFLRAHDTLSFISLSIYWCY